MNHLFASTVEVLRMEEVFVAGQPTYDWVPQTFGRRKTVKCRIDLTFQPVRPGQPMVLEAGRARDRQGMAWFDPDIGRQIKPGDRVRCVSGPITGVFTLDELGEQVAGFSTLHHYEFGVKEVAQAIAAGGGTTG